MSLEQIIKVLEDFGFNRVNAEVYVFLAKNGPKQVKDLTYVFNYSRAKIQRSLKKLQDQNMVTASIESPIIFSAVPLEKILDRIINAKIEQAQKMKFTKDLFNNLTK